MIYYLRLAIQAKSMSLQPSPKSFFAVLLTNPLYVL
jgi:hypothetical protein